MCVCAREYAQFVSRITGVNKQVPFMVLRVYVCVLCEYVRPATSSVPALVCLVSSLTQSRKSPAGVYPC